MDETKIHYHTVGVGQQYGTVRFHIFKDCFHLLKNRTMGPMDMTGVITEALLPKGSKNICKLCQKRAARKS